MSTPLNYRGRDEVEQPPPVRGIDGLEGLLLIGQSLLTAYAVVAFLTLTLTPDLNTGPIVGRMALVWRDYVMVWTQLAATIAAYYVTRRRDPHSYLFFAMITATHFSLVIATFAILSSVAVYESSGPSPVYRVRIDRDWPSLVVAWFLFCNPVAILLIVRAAIGTSRCATTADGG